MNILVLQNLPGDYESEPGNSISDVALVVLSVPLKDGNKEFRLGGIADHRHMSYGITEKDVRTVKEEGAKITKSMALALWNLFPSSVIPVITHEQACANAQEKMKS